MNKSTKLLFIVFVGLVLFSSLAFDVNAWSLFGWLKSIFAKKDVQPAQAQPSQNNLNNIQKSKNIYDKQFPKTSGNTYHYYLINLQDIKNKCIIYDKILNYCKEKNLKNWNNKNSRYYKYNQYGYLNEGKSMTPLIPIGSKLAIQKYIPFEKLHSCEIIGLDMGNKGIYYHRIIGFGNNEGIIVTRGDANKKDNYEVINRGEVISKVCGKLE